MSYGGDATAMMVGASEPSLESLHRLVAPVFARCVDNCVDCVDDYVFFCPSWPLKVLRAADLIGFQLQSWGLGFTVYGLRV